LVFAAASALALLGEGSGIHNPADEGNGAYLWPSRLPQTITWCLAALAAGARVDPRLGVWRPVRALSRHSLGIFLLHPLFLDLLGPHTAALPGPVRVPLLLAASFGAAYVLVRLLALNRRTAAAIGEEPPRRERELSLAAPVEGGGLVGPAEPDLDAGAELGHGEGLAHVVADAQLEALRL
jgi:peptidoglycan/LPS O-acetylase OafA/YrhL